MRPNMSKLRPKQRHGPSNCYMFEVQNRSCEGQNPSYEGPMSLWEIFLVSTFELVMPFLVFVETTWTNHISPGCPILELEVLRLADDDDAPLLLRVRCRFRLKRQSRQNRSTAHARRLCPQCPRIQTDFVGPIQNNQAVYCKPGAPHGPSKTFLFKAKRHGLCV